MRIDPVTGLKVCPGCKDRFPEGKPIDSFSKHAKEPDGLNYTCRECKSVASKASYQRNSDTVKTLQRIKKAKKMESDPEGLMLWRARERARKEGVPCSITRKDIYIPERCPIGHCGNCYLTRGVGKFSPFSPSLDRFDSKLGYIPGNVWVVCQKCNRDKQNMTGEEHVTFGLQLIYAFKEENERVAELQAQG
jgi:hypothetical protein